MVALHSFMGFSGKRRFSQRANILVDDQGRIAFVKVYELKQLPDVNEIIDLLKG